MDAREVYDFVNRGRMLQMEIPPIVSEDRERYFNRIKAWLEEAKRYEIANSPAIEYLLPELRQRLDPSNLPALEE